MERLRHRLPLLAAAILIPVLAITFIGVGGTDDAHITLGAVRRLVETGQILNYNGERIEQSSSLLHVLILALAVWTTHLPLIWIAWAIGILAAMATVVMVGVLADRVRPGCALVASLLTALSTPFLYWAVGSLETPIAALLLTCVVSSSLRFLRTGPGSWWRQASPPAIAIALFTMIRPEGGPVLLLGFALSLILLHRLHRDDREIQRRTNFRLLALASVAFLVSVVLVAFRLAYFGRAVPQPVWAKSSISIARFGEGFSYLVESIDLSVKVLVVLAVIGLWHLRHRWTDGTILTGALLLSLSLTIVASGGDWMPFGRFLCVGLPLLAVFASIGIAAVSSESRSRRVSIVSIAILLMAFGGFVHLSDDSMGTPIWTHPVWKDSGVEPINSPWLETRHRGHLRDVAASPMLARVVDALSESQSEIVRVGSPQAGAVVYNTIFTEQSTFRFVDVLSLSTNEFSKCISNRHSRYGFGIGAD
ncbi:MAG: hypothetical protein F2837_06600, partial [Actinobacteria bacterium]|nr:hypothetical protein [Actinomycetota bacterium]